MGKEIKKVCKTIYVRRIEMDIKKIQKIYEEKVLNEGPVNLIRIADSFTRYLIGDRNLAISELKKMQQLPTPGLSKIEAGEFNKLFENMRSDILKTLSKHMKKVINP